MHCLGWTADVKFPHLGWKAGLEWRAYYSPGVEKLEPETYRSMAQLEQRHWWFVARRKIIAKVIGTFSLPPDAKILEAGSGTGGNLKMLSEFGLVTGMEPSELARSFVQERGNWHVVDGSLPGGVPFEDNTFDMVAVLDVLEHLDQDQESLSALVRSLKPGGMVLVTVPAFPFLWSAHDETHHHRRRYRRRQIVEVLNQSGLQTTYATYFNSILFLPAVAVRMTKRLLKRQTADMQSLPATPINQILTWLFGLERFVIPTIRLPAGLSLLVIGQKPAA